MPKTTYVWDELSDNVIEEYEDGVLSASYTHCQWALKTSQLEALQNQPF